jgi:hypothetical protein
MVPSFLSAFSSVAEMFAKEKPPGRHAPSFMKWLQNEEVWHLVTTFFRKPERELIKGIQEFNMVSLNWFLHYEGITILSMWLPFE